MGLQRMTARVGRESEYAPTLFIGLLIFLAFLALRLPFRAEFLVNWDAVNFALGTEFFSIQQHQPHPPGYIGYVVLGRLLNTLTGDANASLTLLSVVSGAISPAILFALGEKFMQRRYALTTALAFGLSPVVWYYSEVALSYSTEMVLTLLFVWFGLAARQDRSPRALLAATLCLTTLGAVRQTGLALLLPMWVYCVWPFSPSRRRRAALIFVIGNLVWFLPLLHLAGGPLAYLREMASIAAATILPTSVLSSNVWGLLQNGVFTALGLLVALNFGLVIAVAAYRQGINPLATLGRDDRIFFALWTLPALATFLLVHAGQVGYILMILPAIFLLIGMTLPRLVPRITSRYARRSQIENDAVIVGIAAFLVFSNAATYFGMQEVVFAFTSPEEEEVREALGEAQENLPAFEERSVEESDAALSAVSRQYNIRHNDATWQALIALIRSYDSETTAILTAPDSAGSFRHVAYYLPEYRVYAVGEDRREIFGYLFSSHKRTSNYSAGRLQFARPVLRLPQDVQRLIVPDPAIYNRLDQSIPQYKVLPENGQAIVVATIPRDTTLTFVDARGQGSGIPASCPPLSGEQQYISQQAPAVENEQTGRISLLPERWTNYRHIEC
jgi:hypothetical protein